MSRKDYVAIAAAIRAEYEAVADGPALRRVVEQTADRIADVFAADNPNFDRERFLRAALGA